MGVQKEEGLQLFVGVVISPALLLQNAPIDLVACRCVYLDTKQRRWKECDDESMWEGAEVVVSRGVSAMLRSHCFLTPTAFFAITGCEGWEADQRPPRSVHEVNR